MKNPPPTMRRGTVTRYLVEVYGLTEHRVRTLFELKVIKPLPKLYKAQKQAYYSLAQIKRDVIANGGLVPITGDGESSPAGSAGEQQNEG